MSELERISVHAGIVNIHSFPFMDVCVVVLVLGASCTTNPWLLGGDGFKLEADPKVGLLFPSSFCAQ